MKNLFIILFICIFLLTECSLNSKTINTQNEKTIVLESNVLVNQIDYSNKISKKLITLKLAPNEIFYPDYFNNNKIYGKIVNLSNNSPSITYAYYSETEGLVKYISNDFSYNQDNLINSIVTLDTIPFNIRVNTDTVLFKNILTGEMKEFDIGLKIVPNSDKYACIMSNRTSTLSPVSNNNNLFYYSLSIQSNIEDSFTYKYTNELSLYDIDRNTTITYSGKLSPNAFPYFSKIIYNEQDKCFYGLSTSNPDKNINKDKDKDKDKDKSDFTTLYKINIKGNKYTIKSIYNFDFGDKLLDTFNVDIIDGNLIFNTFLWSSDTADTQYQVDYKIIVFNLKDKAIVKTVGSDTDSSFNPPYGYRDFNKYFFVNTNFTMTEKQTYPNFDVFLSRLNDNNIEYLYKFDKPMNTILSQDSKQMFSHYYNEETKTSEYYLYDINID